MPNINIRNLLIDDRLKFSIETVVSGWYNKVPIVLQNECVNVRDMFLKDRLKFSNRIVKSKTSVLVYSNVTYNIRHLFINIKPGSRTQPVVARPPRPGRSNRNFPCVLLRFTPIPGQNGDDTQLLSWRIIQVSNFTNLRNFYASPQTIEEGESSTLFWYVENFPIDEEFKLNIQPGVGYLNSSAGEIAVKPLKTTRYTLYIQTPFGESVGTATVVVRRKPQGGDIAIDFQNGEYSLGFYIDDVMREQGLRNAVLLSLFVNKRSDFSSGSWWDPNFGSDLEKLVTNKLSNTLMQIIAAEVYDSLRWLISEKVVRKISVEVLRTGYSSIKIYVTFFRPTGSGTNHTYDFDYNWNKEISR